MPVINFNAVAPDVQVRMPEAVQAPNIGNAFLDAYTRAEDKQYTRDRQAKADAWQAQVQQRQQTEWQRADATHDAQMDAGRMAASGDIAGASKRLMTSGDIDGGFTITQKQHDHLSKIIEMGKAFSAAAAAATSPQEWAAFKERVQPYGIDMSAYDDADWTKSRSKFLLDHKYEETRLTQELARRKLVAEVGKLEAEASKTNAEAAGAQASGGLNPKQRLDAEEGMRKEMTTLLKGHTTISQASENLEALAANPNAMTDVALIYSYMKVLDPDSVVRETEFATAQNAASVPDAIRNQFNRALSGEFLNEDQRQQMLDAARSIAQVQRQNYDRNITHYKGIAERSGLRFDNIQPATPSPIKGAARQAPTGSPQPSPPQVSAASVGVARLREAYQQTPPEKRAELLQSYNRAFGHLAAENALGLNMQGPNGVPFGQ